MLRRVAQRLDVHDGLGQHLGGKARVDEAASPQDLDHDRAVPVEVGAAPLLEADGRSVLGLARLDVVLQPAVVAEVDVLCLLLRDGLEVGVQLVGTARCVGVVVVHVKLRDARHLDARREAGQHVRVLVALS